MDHGRNLGSQYEIEILRSNASQSNKMSGFSHNFPLPTRHGYIHRTVTAASERSSPSPMTDPIDGRLRSNSESPSRDYSRLFFILTLNCSLLDVIDGIVRFLEGTESKH